MSNEELKKELEELRNRVAILEELNKLKQRVDKLQKDLSTPYRYYPPIYYRWYEDPSPYKIWYGTVTSGDTTTYTGDKLFNGKK